ncbi:MAG: SRPBCC family protein [Microthrixaceae bacterium]
MTYDLKLERLIDASPEEVFDAFTDPAAQREWYLDSADFVVTSSVDLRVGGAWTTTFGPAGEAPYAEENVFTEVDRPARVAYRSTFWQPDGTSFDTDLVVTFEVRDGKTLLTILQSGFEREQDRDDHQGGWPGFIDRLERYAVAHKTA